MEERVSDYDQHTSLLPEEEQENAFGRVPSPYFPPALNSATHYPSQTRPSSALFGKRALSQRTLPPTGRSWTANSSLPPQETVNPLSQQPNFSSGTTPRSGLSTPRTPATPSKAGDDTPSSSSSLASHYHRTRTSSWNKGNSGTASALYLPSSQQSTISRIPSNAQLYSHLPPQISLPTEIGREGGRPQSSFSSNTSTPHLYPSSGNQLDEMTQANKSDDLNDQYDLTEKYSDTIGPRDILNSQL